jgi:hypothetical protein
MTPIHFLALWLLPLALGSPTIPKRAGTPTVTLSHQTVIGSSSPTNNIETFNGFPFTQPPIGYLRSSLPLPVTTNLGTIEATSTPYACPQFSSQTGTSLTSYLSTLLTDPESTLLSSALGVLGATQRPVNGSEDCLTVNIYRPSGIGIKTPSCLLDLWRRV